MFKRWGFMIFVIGLAMLRIRFYCMKGWYITTTSRLPIFILLLIFRVK